MTGPIAVVSEPERLQARLDQARAELAAAKDRDAPLLILEATARCSLLLGLLATARRRERESVGELPCPDCEHLIRRHLALGCRTCGCLWRTP